MANIPTEKTLTPQVGNELLNAFQRYHFLCGQTIVTEIAEAEKRGLKNYLDKTFMEYGANLIGCWIVMKNEYEPLIESIASLLGRATGLLAQREAALKAKQEANEKAS